MRYAHLEIGIEVIIVEIPPGAYRLPARSNHPNCPPTPPKSESESSVDEDNKRKFRPVGIPMALWNKMPDEAQTQIIQYQSSLQPSASVSAGVYSDVLNYLAQSQAELVANLKPIAQKNFQE